MPHLAKTHRAYLVQINGFGGDDSHGNLRAGILDGVIADLAGSIAANNIACPAMMIGARDPQATGSVRVVDALPLFSLLSDSWHFIMLDQPAAFQQAIDAFLGARPEKID